MPTDEGAVFTEGSQPVPASDGDHLPGQPAPSSPARRPDHRADRGTPPEVAPAAKAGVGDLRQAANPDHPDEGRVKSALGKIAMSVAIAASTEAGRKIIDLIGNAQQFLAG